MKHEAVRFSMKSFVRQRCKINFPSSVLHYQKIRFLHLRNVSLKWERSDKKQFWRNLQISRNYVRLLDRGITHLIWHRESSFQNWRSFPVGKHVLLTPTPKQEAPDGANLVSDIAPLKCKRNCRIIPWNADLCTIQSVLFMLYLCTTTNLES